MAGAIEDAGQTPGYWDGARAINACVFILVCAGLPLAGLKAAGYEPAVYLKFPPVVRETGYPGFSLVAFAGLTILALVIFVWWTAGHLRNRKPVESREIPVLASRDMPWWGVAGLFALTVSWALAWTRFDWFAALQSYTFTPLWLSFIVVVNGITFKRCGKCPLTGEPGRFFLLFPASAVFWWFFEYLNRFVQNWIYLEVETIGAAEYLIHASVCFSTVLPAVYSVKCLLDAFPQTRGIFQAGPLFRLRWEAEAGALLFLCVCAVFFLIGLYPQYLFPALWAGPLLGWLCLNRITRRPVSLGGVRRGDWSYVLNWALAALVCGFFWEMWNLHSQAKWVYDIPYFEGIYLFEMPLAGYTGYLPFGLECALAAEAVFALKRSLQPQSCAGTA